MSEHADGSIIIDTELDSKGFKAGSNELKKAVNSLSTKVNNLGPTLQKAVSGSASAMSTFNAKATNLESTIEQIKTRMASLGSQRVETEEYTNAKEQCEKLEKSLLKLQERQDKMQAFGVGEDSKAWQSLQYDIQKTEEELSRYESLKNRLETSGGAFQMGADTSQYKQLSSDLVAAESRLAEMRQQADGAGASTSRLSRIGQGIKSAFGGVGRAAKKGFSLAINGAKAAGNGVKSLVGKLKNANTPIKGLTKKLTGFFSMMSRMAKRKLIMAIFEGAKEGFNNLAQYSTKTNQSLSQLKSGLTQMKNSFATAFAPLLNAVAPILTKIISYINAAITAFGKLIAAFTGAKTFTRAKEVQEDYAASLDKTSKSAKKASKTITGLDEINALNDNSSSDAGGGGGVSPGDMFEEVPIESNILDFVNRIKDAFAKGDFSGIGEMLGNKVNGVIEKVRAVVNWDKLGGPITKFVKGLADGFNSLLHTVDWNGIGATIGGGVDVIIHTLHLLITEIDWPGITAAFSEGANGLLSAIDWAEVGTTLSDGVMTLIKSFRSLIKTFDWEQLGRDISEALNNIDWPGLFGEAAGAISDILIAALDLCIGFVEELDWGKLGRDLWDSLVEIIENIDWGELIAKAFRLLGDVLGGATALIVGFCTEMWESLKQGWEDTKSYFTDYIDEAGGNIIEGLFNGITDALKNVGTWIKENIWDPFIEGFCNAFGIHSPSRKMEEQGPNIVDGLKNGITACWHNITDFFKEKLEAIKTTVKNTWESVRSTTKEKFTQAKDAASTAFSNMKASVSDTASSIRTKVSNSWVDLKNNTASKFSEIKSSITGTFSNLKDSASIWGKDLCDNMANGINKAKNAVEGAVRGVADKIKSFLGFSEPEDGPLSNFHTYMPDMIDLMVKGIKQNESRAIKAVSNLAGAISNEIANGNYAFGSISTSSVDGFMTDFADTITDGFTTLIDRLETIANGVSFTAPVVASGILPYQVSATVATATGSNNAEIVNGVTGVSRETRETNNLLREQNRYLLKLLEKDFSSGSPVTTGSIIAGIKQNNRRIGKSVIVVDDT